MKAPLIFLTAATAIALTSCSNPSMQVDTQPVAGVDYSAYKTYEWVPIDRNTAGELTHEEIDLRAAFVDEVDSIMQRRGLTKVGQGKSDIIVYARGLRMAGASAIATNIIYPNYYQPDASSSQWLGDTGDLTKNTKTSARFLISEPKTDKVIWRGKASVTIDEKAPRPLAEHDARLLARKLMAGFPRK